MSTRIEQPRYAPPAGHDEPFHGGERAMQARAGVRDKMAVAGPRFIRDHMPDEHRAFFSTLPFVLVASIDAAGQPHASIVAGPPGFVQAPDERRLVVAAAAGSGDPLADHLQPGARLGLLGIEAHTRRRNRMNGIVSTVSGKAFSVAVQQSFGNCPKYIQAREARWTDRSAGAETRITTHLDEPARALICRADTFYIASSFHSGGRSAPANEGADMSHRGGKPGFVRVDRDASGADRLTVPDFVGNFVFNTLGNLAANARAGLLFIDFETGDLLQLSSEAEIIWDGPELASFAGAQRLLRLRITASRFHPARLPLRWGPARPSPFLTATGRWQDAT